MNILQRILNGDLGRRFHFRRKKTMSHLSPDLLQKKHDRLTEIDLAIKDFNRRPAFYTQGLSRTDQSRMEEAFNQLKIERCKLLIEVHSLSAFLNE